MVEQKNKNKYFIFTRKGSIYADKHKMQCMSFKDICSKNVLNFILELAIVNMPMESQSSYLMAAR